MAETFPSFRRSCRSAVEVGQLVEAMWWHPVFDDDPEHTYLRDVVARPAAAT